MAETLQKAAAHLCETLEITFRHYKTLQVNLNMADEAAHTCSQVTGSGRLRTNKTWKLSLKLGTEKGRDISHWDVQSVQTFLVSCLPLRCRLFSESFLLRWSWDGFRGGGVCMTTRTDAFFVCGPQSVGFKQTNKSPHSPTSPVSFRTQTVKQVIDCRDFGEGSGSVFMDCSRTGLWSVIELRMQI